MFLLDDGVIVYSATDLTAAADCEYALLRSLDAKLGRSEPLDLPADAMLARAASLGDDHEARVLAGLVDRHGPWDRASGRGVATISRPHGRPGRAQLDTAREETLEALRAGADVVFQAAFFDGRFSGWADFLVREADGEHAGSYAVYDTKLARHAKVTALLQLAAYADQLLNVGIPTAPRVHLWLGDSSISSHRLDDLLPVYRARRARLEQLLDSHQESGGVVTWGAAGHRACLRCELCAAELEERRDVLLVAGLRTTQRARLNAVGVTTIDELGTGEGPVDGIGTATLDRLRAQARLQAAQEDGELRYEVHAPAAIARLPLPSPGDIFFDFEGDPLWTERPGHEDWGLEYLFGLVEAPPTPDTEPVFRAFWAHDRVEEKQALVDFLAYIEERRRRYPHMHIYHYAPYERTALLRLAGRHGVGESAIDQLLREGVLVDLYATVRQSLRTGQDSSSLKKLEPLYMSGAREGAVVSAGESIVEYAEATALRDAGRHEEWQEHIDDIADYNRLDCISTMLLRDWLAARGTELGHPPAGAEAPATSEDDDAAPERDELALALWAHADAVPPGEDGERDADRQAVALLAAALDYHWREDKPFWWAHFDRLRSDPAEWAEARDTFLVEEVAASSAWEMPPGKRTLSRELELVGRLEPGSELAPGTRWLLYEPPLPEKAKTSTTGHRGWVMQGAVTEVTALPDGRHAVTVTERVPMRTEGHAMVPMALAPVSGPPTKVLKEAIAGLAREVRDQLPTIPGHPALDLARRRPPRLSGTHPLPTATPTTYAEAITAAVQRLDGSYLAVQGPPGTGKTYVGARVITALVADGWRIGVVGQSHAVVENLLRGVVGAGVPGTAVGKKPAAGNDPDPHAPWTWITGDRYAPFYAANPGGYVVGGTAWDFVNATRLPDAPLDLLVIDEAGQFSLANTIAVSTAARNLLLLGDPQQLPQVSQGTHPEPVDRSALGWLTDGHDTLPPELGYFLAGTWRMHPALADAVSRLSYERRLTSMPHTAERSLEGIAPGVRSVLVEHEGNAVASTEEAEEVVAQVRAHLGRRWQDPSDGTDRPLAEVDVLVVAAYNAQVSTIRRALAAADLTGVRVGTVDKFQGQQAPVVIVSMAASSPQDVPRGMEFLLNRNRVNVAVSRGQWCALLIHSPALTDYLPARPFMMAELGAFLGLTDDPDHHR